MVGMPWPGQRGSGSVVVSVERFWLVSKPRGYLGDWATLCNHSSRRFVASAQPACCVDFSTASR